MYLALAVQLGMQTSRVLSGIKQTEQLKNEWKYKHVPGGGPVAQQLVLPFQNWKSQLTCLQTPGSNPKDPSE